MLGLFGTAIAAFLGYVILVIVRDWLRYKDAPGLGTYYPLVGHFPTLLANAETFYPYFRKRCAELGYPPVVLIKTGVLEQPRWQLLTREDLEHVLKPKFDNYHVSSGIRGEVLRDFLGDGIFNTDGHNWLLQRKLASREFSANRFRFFMSDVFRRAAGKLVAVLDGEVAAAPAGQAAVVDMHRWFFTLTLDAFSEIAFGLDVGGLDGKPQPFIAAFDKCQEQSFNRVTKHTVVWRVMKALNVGPEREMAEALRTVDSFVYSVMDDLLAGKRQLPQGRTEGDEDDLLRRLLPAAKRDDGTYDRKLVRDMLLSLILAGRDTTAASMSWTLYELSRRPAVVKEVLDELDAVAGPGQALTFDNVGQCHYLQAVLSESQRLYPTVPSNPKAAMGPDHLPAGNVPIVRGDTVSPVNYVMGVHPKIWGPDAAEFKPERWMLPDGTCKKEDAFKYPAFNAGRRLCLGMDMANLEMKVVLGTLLRRFDFKLVDNQVVEPAVALTLSMKHPLRMLVSHRK